jgi:phage portal protein BeeE
VDALNGWLVRVYGGNLELVIDLDDVPALSPRRDSLWERVKGADFLDEDEKRALVGVGSID